MRMPHTIWSAALILAALGSAGLAQIKSFTLDEMVLTADNAVYGQIVHSSRCAKVLSIAASCSDLD